MANSQSATGYALPLELIREICELSALAFPSSIPRLSLVAHQIRHWVEPVLYRILRIDEDIVKPPIFLRPITEQTRKYMIDSKALRPINIQYLQKFGHHVQHALLQDCHILEIAQILTHIPSVQHLAMWVIIGERNLGPASSSLAPCLDYVHETSSLSLKKVSCNFLEIYQGFHTVPFHKSYFKEVTHLEVIFAEDDYRWSRWEEISLLDKLTHLCISHPVTISLVARLLRNCTKLEVLIFFGFGGSLIGDEEEVGLGHSAGLATESSIPVQDDPRVVSMHPPKHDNFLNSWEIEARGGTSFWDVATQVVQERKDSGWSGNNSLEIIEFDGGKRSE